MTWKPPPIEGLRWIAAYPEQRHWKCVFEPTAGLQTADKLLALIPRGGSFQFLDSLYHGRPPVDARTDPGAIFCVYRRWFGGLVVTCGNHGWSTPAWQPVERAALASFLLESRASNVGDRRIGDRVASGDAPGSEAMSFYRRAHYRPRRGAIDANSNLLVRKDLYSE